jgi:hypothetical protein
VAKPDGVRYGPELQAQLPLRFGDRYPEKQKNGKVKVVTPQYLRGSLPVPRSKPEAPKSSWMRSMERLFGSSQDERLNEQFEQYCASKK